MVPPFSTNAYTVLLAEGFQALAQPVDPEASRAAKRLRLWLPMLLNAPPAYTVVPTGKRQFTAWLAEGSQLVRVPVPRLRAAILLRVWPRNVLKLPPT